MEEYAVVPTGQTAFSLRDPSSFRHTTECGQARICISGIDRTESLSGTVMRIQEL